MEINLDRQKPRAAAMISLLNSERRSDHVAALHEFSSLISSADSEIAERAIRSCDLLNRLICVVSGIIVAESTNQQENLLAEDVLCWLLSLVWSSSDSLEEDRTYLQYHPSLKHIAKALVLKLKCSDEGAIHTAGVELTLFLLTEQDTPLLFEEPLSELIDAIMGFLQMNKELNSRFRYNTGDATLARRSVLATSALCNLMHQMPHHMISLHERWAEAILLDIIFSCRWDKRSFDLGARPLSLLRRTRNDPNDGSQSANGGIDPDTPSAAEHAIRSAALHYSDKDFRSADADALASEASRLFPNLVGAMYLLRSIPRGSPALHMLLPLAVATFVPVMESLITLIELAMRTLLQRAEITQPRGSSLQEGSKSSQHSTAPPMHELPNKDITTTNAPAIPAVMSVIEAKGVMNFCADVWRLYIEILSHLITCSNQEAFNVSAKATELAEELNDAFKLQDAEIIKLVQRNSNSAAQSKISTISTSTSTSNVTTSANRSTNNDAIAAETVESALNPLAGSKRTPEGVPKAPSSVSPRDAMRPPSSIAMVVPKAIELLYPPALKQQQLYDEPKLEGLYDVGPRMFMNLIAPDRIQGPVAVFLRKLSRFWRLSSQCLLCLAEAINIDKDSRRRSPRKIVILMAQEVLLCTEELRKHVIVEPEHEAEALRTTAKALRRLLQGSWPHYDKMLCVGESRPKTSAVASSSSALTGDASTMTPAASAPAATAPPGNVQVRLSFAEIIAKLLEVELSPTADGNETIIADAEVERLFAGIELTTAVFEGARNLLSVAPLPEEATRTRDKKNTFKRSRSPNAFSSSDSQTSPNTSQPRSNPSLSPLRSPARRARERARLHTESSPPTTVGAISKTGGDDRDRVTHRGTSPKSVRQLEKDAADVVSRYGLFAQKASCPPTDVYYPEIDQILDDFIPRIKLGFEKLGKISLMNLSENARERYGEVLRRLVSAWQIAVNALGRNILKIEGQAPIWTGSQALFSGASQYAGSQTRLRMRTQGDGGVICTYDEDGNDHIVVGSASERARDAVEKLGEIAMELWVAFWSNHDHSTTKTSSVTRSCAASSSHPTTPLRDRGGGTDAPQQARVNIHSPENSTSTATPAVAALTSLSVSFAHERQMYVESIWWFLHRVSGFGVSINIQIFGPMLRYFDSSSCAEDSPLDMSGVATLLAAAHIRTTQEDRVNTVLLDYQSSCITTTSTTTISPRSITTEATEEEGGEIPLRKCDCTRRWMKATTSMHQPHGDLCICSLRWAASRCMRSLVEAARLLGILRWMVAVCCTSPRISPDADKFDHLLGRGQEWGQGGQGQGQRQGQGRGQGQISLDLTDDSTTPAVSVIYRRSMIVDDRPLSDYFVSLLHDMFLLLGTMQAPSESGLGTPGEIENLTEGLQNLLNVPLIMMATGQWGLGHLNDTTVSPLKLGNGAAVSQSTAQILHESVMPQWKSLFSLWLTLQQENARNESEYQGFIEEEQPPAEEGQLEYVLPLEPLNKKQSTSRRPLPLEHGGILTLGYRATSVSCADVLLSLRMLLAASEAVEEYRSKLLLTHQFPLAVPSCKRVSTHCDELVKKLNSILVNVVSGWTSAMKSCADGEGAAFIDGRHLNGSDYTSDGRSNSGDRAKQVFDTIMQVLSNSFLGLSLQHRNGVTGSHTADSTKSAAAAPAPATTANNPRKRKASDDSSITTAAAVIEVVVVEDKVDNGSHVGSYFSSSLYSSVRSPSVISQALQTSPLPPAQSLSPNINGANGNLPERVLGLPNSRRKDSAGAGTAEYNQFFRGSMLGAILQSLFDGMAYVFLSEDTPMDENVSMDILSSARAALDDDFCTPPDASSRTQKASRHRGAQAQQQYKERDQVTRTALREDRATLRKQCCGWITRLLTLSSSLASSAESRNLRWMYLEIRSIILAFLGRIWPAVNQPQLPNGVREADRRGEQTANNKSIDLPGFAALREYSSAAWKEFDCGPFPDTTTTTAIADGGQSKKAAIEATTSIPEGRGTLEIDVPLFAAYGANSRSFAQTVVAAKATTHCNPSTLAASAGHKTPITSHKDPSDLVLSSDSTVAPTASTQKSGGPGSHFLSNSPSNVTYLKVAAEEHGDNLHASFRRARQFCVPATYTNADRRDLNYHSQSLALSQSQSESQSLLRGFLEDSDPTDFPTPKQKQAFPPSSFPDASMPVPEMDVPVSPPLSSPTVCNSGDRVFVPACASSVFTPAVCEHPASSQTTDGKSGIAAEPTDGKSGIAVEPTDGKSGIAVEPKEENCREGTTGNGENPRKAEEASSDSSSGNEESQDLCGQEVPKEATGSPRVPSSPSVPRRERNESVPVVAATSEEITGGIAAGAAADEIISPSGGAAKRDLIKKAAAEDEVPRSPIGSQYESDSRRQYETMATKSHEPVSHDDSSGSETQDNTNGNMTEANLIEEQEEKEKENEHQGEAEEEDGKEDKEEKAPPPSEDAAREGDFVVCGLMQPIDVPVPQNSSSTSPHPVPSAVLGTRTRALEDASASASASAPALLDQQRILEEGAYTTEGILTAYRHSTDQIVSSLQSMAKVTAATTTMPQTTTNSSGDGIGIVLDPPARQRFPADDLTTGPAGTAGREASSGTHRETGGSHDSREVLLLEALRSSHRLNGILLQMLVDRERSLQKKPK